jgi:hypothetical protein
VLKREPPSGAEWLHEVKHDGWRAQLHLSRGKSTVYGKTGGELTRGFASITAAVEGEIVNLRPEYRLALAREGYALVAWACGVRARGMQSDFLSYGSDNAKYRGLGIKPVCGGAHLQFHLRLADMRANRLGTEVPARLGEKRPPCGDAMRVCHYLVTNRRYRRRIQRGRAGRGSAPPEQRKETTYGSVCGGSNGACNVVNCRTHVPEKRAAMNRVDFLVAQLNNVFTI